MKKLIAGMARLVAVTCAFTALGTPRPENVPELMKTFGGEKVETLEQWEKIRAPEILERYRNECYKTLGLW